MRLGTSNSVQFLRLRKEKKRELRQKEKTDFENVINIIFIDQQQPRIEFRSAYGRFIHAHDFENNYELWSERNGQFRFQFSSEVIEGKWRHLAGPAASTVVIWVVFRDCVDVGLTCQRFLFPLIQPFCLSAPSFREIFDHD